MNTPKITFFYFFCIMIAIGFQLGMILACAATIIFSDEPSLLQTLPIMLCAAISLIGIIAFLNKSSYEI